MIERRIVTGALAAVLAGATGKPCGIGGVSMAGDAPAPPPYTVLTSLPLTLDGAPFADSREDALTIYQATIVARSHDQAEWLADQVRTAVLGRAAATGEWLHPLAVPGWTCWLRELDLDAGTDSDPGAVIVSYVIRFRLAWTPAG